MKLIFKTSTTGTKVLTGFITFYLAAPVVILYGINSVQENGWEVTIIAGLVSSAPFLLIFIIILYKIKGQKITVARDTITYKSSTTEVIIRWDNVTHFYFDYISIDNSRYGTSQNYKVFEIGDGTSKIRFNEGFGLFKKTVRHDYTHVKALQKKNFLFDTYGITLGKKDLEKLVNWITSSTNHYPERNREFMM